MSPETKAPTSTLIVILGPTASGKTSAAINLAEKLNTEIISADSRQFYREMRIGTARPTREQLERVPHHFVGHLSVKDDYNVSKFETDSLKVLENLFKSNTVAIAVGGSGLYIDAMCKGIDDLPDPDPELRKQLIVEYEQFGLERIQGKLLELDPDYYKAVDLKNPKRILRALEVCMMTGKTYSSFRLRNPKPRNFNVRKFGLDIPREALNQRIHQRVDEMMVEGLLDEVRSLVEYRHLNALNTVGYKELLDYLDHRCSLEDAVEKIKTNTRRYAKRQMTWFRKDKDISWVSDWDELYQQVPIVRIIQ